MPLQREVGCERAGQPSDSRWSAGNNKGIEKGARVFLLKQGRRQPGLMASGWVVRETHEDELRDPQKRPAGIRGLFVRVKCDALVLPDDVLPKAELLKRLLPANTMRAACNGVGIPADYAERLERRWAEHYRAVLRRSS